MYGFRFKRTSPHQVEREVQAALLSSIEKVKDLKRKKEEDDSDDDYNPAMEVAAAADRKVREDKSSRTVTRDFGCHGCLRVVKASAVAPVKVHVTVEHWHGWADPLSGPEKWEDVTLKCADCAAPDLEKAAEARKRQREYNEERANKQSKRLEAHSTSNDAEDNAFMEKLRKLKAPQLSELCLANAMLKTGKKDQLIERLFGVWRFGSLSKCPSCNKGCLELQYKEGNSEPTAIKCKHMRGQGRPCGFYTKLPVGATRQVLTTPLRDNASGDLASVGINVEN